MENHRFISDAGDLSILESMSDGQPADIAPAIGYDGEILAILLDHALDGDIVQEIQAIGSTLFPWCRKGVPLDGGSVGRDLDDGDIIRHHRRWHHRRRLGLGWSLPKEGGSGDQGKEEESLDHGYLNPPWRRPWGLVPKLASSRGRPGVAQDCR